MAETNDSPRDVSPVKPVGRRGWFKQAGTAAVGLALGSRLDAAPTAPIVKSARVEGLAKGGAMRSRAQRRGIDCGYDEGPI